MTMELDSFRSRLGEGQGRVESAGGEILFILGDAEPGREVDLVIGDYAEVVQVTDLTGVTLIRARLLLKVPSGMPSGLAWEVSVVVDGIKKSGMTCDAGRTRLITDLAANVSKLSGMHEVGVRLQLVSM